MNTIKCFFFLLFVAAATGNDIHNRRRLDPLGPQRELCRKQMGLTEEQLKAGYEDFNSVSGYFLCVARGLRILNDDGTINTKILIQTLKTQLPLVILEPIAECCQNEVYHGRRPARNQITQLLIAYSNCWKRELTPTLFNLTGALQKPVYPALKTCRKH